LSKSHDEIAKAGAVVLEVSTDDVDTQRRWTEELGAPFAILSDADPKGSVASAFGVLSKNRGTARRSSFVIDRDGIIRDVRIYPPGSIPSPAKLLEVIRTL